MRQLSWTFLVAICIALVTHTSWIFPTSFYHHFLRWTGIAHQPPTPSAVMPSIKLRHKEESSWQLIKKPTLSSLWNRLTNMKEKGTGQQPTENSWSIYSRGICSMIGPGTILVHPYHSETFSFANHARIFRFIWNPLFFWWGILWWHKLLWREGLLYASLSWTGRTCGLFM